MGRFWPFAGASAAGYPEDCAVSSSFEGRVFFSSDTLLYCGPGRRTPAHAHHAFRVVLSPARSLCVQSRNASACGRYALIPPGALHAVADESEAVTILYADPDGETGLALRSIALDAQDPTTWFQAAAPLEDLRSTQVGEFGEATSLGRAIRILLTDGRAVELSRRARHPAVRVVRQVVDQDIAGDLSVGRLARQVGLSVGRLGHLFPEEMGISLRRYILSRRLYRAGRSVEAGRSLTYAAHEAGFTDLSHMHRVFRRSFGFRPSLLSRLHWMQPASSS